MVGNRPLTVQMRLTSKYAPTRAHESDAGWDLYVAKPMTLLRFTPTDVPCGFDIALPPGYWASITGRSSTIRKHNVIVSDAVIDPGYRGPMFVCMTYIGPSRWIEIEEGWRMSQLILQRVENITWKEVEEFPPSDRGDKGFGSSGK